MVVSIGYERRSIYELVELLRGRDIGVLLDVREGRIAATRRLLGECRSSP